VYYIHGAELMKLIFAVLDVWCVINGGPYTMLWNRRFLCIYYYNRQRKTPEISWDSSSSENKTITQ